MLRASRKWLAALLLAGLVVAVTGRAPAADPPLAGKWKFKDVSNGREVTLAILQIVEKDGKTEMKVLSSPLLGDNFVPKDVRVEGTSVHFTFTAGPGAIAVHLAAAKGDDKPKTLRGSIQIGARTLLGEFEKTELKEISQEDAVKGGPATEALDKARRNRDEKEREVALKEVVEKFPNTGAAYAAADLLWLEQIKDGGKDADVRVAIDRFLKVAAGYGPAVEQNSVLSAAQFLTRAEKVSPLAVEYARKAEKALTKDDSLTKTATVLKTLASALKKSGKADEAKEITTRIAKLEEQLDAEFEKTAIPFKPAEFKGREGKSKRVVVVELFTGAQCPPCVAADVALKTYKPADVVLLQYHLHIPRPDPLTNADSEKRAQFYGGAIEGTPTTLISGKATEEGLGGGRPASKGSYDELCKAVEKALEAEDQGSLKLSVERKGDKIEAKADVADLKKTGEKVRLRFVLVEDVVRYAGTNGQRLHHHVVRAFPGGVDGFELKEAKASQAVTVLLGDLSKNLGDYLTESNKKRPFLDEERPVDLKHLKLVALIQDDASKEILQAAQVDVPEAK